MSFNTDESAVWRDVHPDLGIVAVVLAHLSSPVISVSCDVSPAIVDGSLQEVFVRTSIPLADMFWHDLLEEFRGGVDDDIDGSLGINLGSEEDVEEVRPQESKIREGEVKGPPNGKHPYLLIGLDSISGQIKHQFQIFLPIQEALTSHRQDWNANVFVLAFQWVWR